MDYATEWTATIYLNADVETMTCSRAATRVEPMDESKPIDR